MPEATRRPFQIVKVETPDGPRFALDYDTENLICEVVFPPEQHGEKFCAELRIPLSGEKRRRHVRKDG